MTKVTETTKPTKATKLIEVTKATKATKMMKTTDATKATTLWLELAKNVAIMARERKT